MPTLDIGGTPAEESCAQIGPDQPADGPRLNRLECRAYILALRAKYGDEPPDCRLRVRSNAHDFGTYCEVAYDYPDDSAPGLAYAARARHL
jgi:hypothetical protein